MVKDWGEERQRLSQATRDWEARDILLGPNPDKNTRSETLVSAAIFETLFPSESRLRYGIGFQITCLEDDMQLLVWKEEKGPFKDGKTSWLVELWE